MTTSNDEEPEESAMPKQIPNMIARVNHMREIRARVGAAAAAEKAQRQQAAQKGE